MHISRKQYFAFIFGVLISGGSLHHIEPARAQQASEINALKDEINERSERLNEIEKEIANYKLELQKVGGEKNTLQKAINQLELERKKVHSDIAYTQNKIGATDLILDKLTMEIEDTEYTIGTNEFAVGETLRLLNVLDNDSLVEALLRHPNLSDFWKQIDELAEIRGVMGDRVKSLVSQKMLLEEKQGETINRREELVDLKQQYTDQNFVLANNKTEKDKLLKETKNEEAEYQKLLKDRETAREQILKELRDFESKLQFILDPNTIPPKGTPVFSWPVENVVITQLFGGTEFAKQNASVYGGRPYHPGVDFGAPRGTPILAPLGGTVRATGDTDLVAGCYSWGKWTLIDHPNGLSTLYAHQSVQSVTPGQSIATGDIVGYIGSTGYSTGPHLHFTVYAKAGVTVRRFNEIKAVTSCGAATTPVAATDAYIDPMNYLPAR
jgi:murein DD-endopeptidase MepM/ murein hydrolase activator NlpD